MRKAQYGNTFSVRLPEELIAKLENHKQFLEYQHPGAYYSLCDIIRMSIIQGLPSGR